MGKSGLQWVKIGKLGQKLQSMSKNWRQVSEKVRIKNSEKKWKNRKFQKKKMKNSEKKVLEKVK